MAATELLEMAVNLLSKTLPLVFRAIHLPSHDSSDSTPHHSSNVQRLWKGCLSSVRVFYNKKGLTSSECS
ncbi:unnamed protein product [Malus baccata var. baccata]